ncbi:MAG: PIG-L deacetylase family protein, partial [Flavobacteriales bacterium]
MKNIILFFFLFFSLSTFANEPVDEIYVNLQKLYSLKRVLYVAAHPDDENTRALAYFSLGERAETAYLSLTRGDGGQNLIGDELSENLGVLRTQELLAARSFDGARQYFTRAVDFGYSRSAEESFLKWGKEELMSDVVLAIRKFRPDVIITRFPPDSRAGHGHHTASAILAIEAFEKANDPNYLPEQVAEFGVWKTTSIYWNTSVWWGEDIEEKAQNSDKYLIQDIGGYNSLLGKSYNEIGTLARSQHKCQGFGGIIERGSRIEYFEHIEGARLKKSFFENNKDSWTNLINTNFETEFQNLLKNFNFIESEKNIPSLFKLREGILGLKDSSFKTEKLALCNSIIVDCLGLHVEVVSNDYAYVGGTEVEVSMNLINRSARLVKLVGYELSGNKKQKTDDLLNENERFQKKIKFQFQEPISGPYWLKNSFENIFEVTNRSDLGKPEEDPSAVGKIWILVDGLEMEIAIPVTYKWRDPSYGERRRKLISAPLYTVNFDQESVILKGKESKKIRMKIHGYEDEIQEFVNVVAPKGWKLSSNKIEFTLEDKHDEVWLEFDLIATDESRKGTLILTDKNGNKIHSYTDITYDHIATQSIFREAKVECVNLNVLINPSKVAYIKG